MLQGRSVRQGWSLRSWATPTEHESGLEGD